jgi:PucR C-terminal helix-turn-helix domain
MTKMSPVNDMTVWSAFIARLGAARDAVPLTAARIAQLPSYRSIPLPELVPEIRRNFAVALRALKERRLPGPHEDVTTYEQSGEQRARQGVTLADMLQGWTTALEISRAGAYRWAPKGENREALLLEAIEIMTAWNTLGMNAAAAAHRRVELQLARQEQHDLANVVRSVLFGGIGGRHLGHLERFGVDPARDYYAVRVRPHEDFDLGEIERWLGTCKSPARPNGLVALIDGDVAGFVAGRPADRPVPVAAGVCGPRPLPAIPDAFRLASRALEAAYAIGRRGLVELPALGLIPSILSDEDVGTGVFDRYVKPLAQDGSSGAIVLDTVERYLRNNCQVYETAAELGVHPNTVRYRVGRFEQRTGHSLKHTESLVEAWWALRRRAIR